MSNKMTCPACNSHTSSVLSAYEEGRPCPICGLSADAAAEILDIRKGRADEALRNRVTELLKERDKLAGDLREAKWKLRRVREALDEAAPEPW